MIFLAARPSLLGPAGASEAWPRGGGGGRSARSRRVPPRMEIAGGGSLTAGQSDVVRRAVSLLDRCDSSHGALVSVCCAQCCRCTPGATRAGARARPARLPDLAGRTVHGRGPFPAGNADCHGPARGGSARKGGVRMARPSVTIGARGGGRIGGNGGAVRTGRPSMRSRRAWSVSDRRGVGAGAQRSRA